MSEVDYQPIAPSRKPPEGRRRLPWPSGRMGRIRYIACVLGLAILYTLSLSLIITVLTMALPPESVPGAFQIWSAGLFLLLMAGLLFWSVERAHDANLPGWVALLVLVPGVNLLFWLWPGKHGDNRYGPPPAPANLLTKIGVCLTVGLLVLSYLYTKTYGPMVSEPPTKPVPQLPAYQE